MSADTASGRIIASYRFDLPDRSIVYTGDTGPSRVVVALAKGADLLVSEMIDVDWTLRSLGRRAAAMTEKDRQNMREHLTAHHLAPAQVAELARSAGVKGVVVTHIAGGGSNAQDADAGYIREIGKSYKGTIAIAHDFGRY